VIITMRERHGVGGGVRTHAFFDDWSASHPPASRGNMMTAIADADEPSVPDGDDHTLRAWDAPLEEVVGAFRTVRRASWRARISRT
jgi:hypothetical protein